MVWKCKTLGIVGAALLLASGVGGGIRGDAQEGRQETLSAVKAPPAQGWRSEVISSARVIKTDLVVPPNVCLTFEDGGTCEVAEGATLTINGSLDAPPVRIFRGGGKVVFATNFAQTVLPQWWGAMPDDGVDDTAAIQAALNSLYTKLPQKGMLPPGGGQDIPLAGQI